MTELVKETLASLSKGLTESMAKIGALQSTFQRLRTEELLLSTISIVARLNIEYMKLKKLTKKFKHKRVQETLRALLAESADSVTLTREDAARAFSNSAILKLWCYRNTVAIKIFNNGSLHITGPTTMEETDDILGIVCTLLSVIYNKPIHAIQVFDVDIQLINTNFYIGYTLNKRAVCDIFRQENFIAFIPDRVQSAGRRKRARAQTSAAVAAAAGDSDPPALSSHPSTTVQEHPAVRLFLPAAGRRGNKGITVFIFQSGAVIITGSKNGTELYEAYARVTAILEDRFDALGAVLPDLDFAFTSRDASGVRVHFNNMNAFTRPALSNRRFRLSESASSQKRPRRKDDEEDDEVQEEEEDNDNDDGDCLAELLLTAVRRHMPVTTAPTASSSGSGKRQRKQQRKRQRVVAASDIVKH